LVFLVNCFEGSFTNPSEGVKGRRHGMVGWDEEGRKEAEQALKVKTWNTQSVTHS